MALRLYSNNPQTLLDEIYKAIDEGHIDTWAYDKDGDFSHTPPQWAGLLWLKPTVENDNLLITTIPPANGGVTVVGYAIYHGRFLEMALRHFDKMFSSSWASALGRSDLGDRGLINS